jgi:ketosteroid isomerase-like protein
MTARAVAIFMAALLAPGDSVVAAQGREGASPPSAELPGELDRVLRDYERLWKAGDAAGLANLFAEDGMALSNGRPPAKGRAAIAAGYGQAGGDLRLRGLAFAMADTVGYIIGAYRYGDAAEDMGKFVLALRRSGNGQWLIAGDIDNSNRRPGPPPTTGQ